MDVVHRISDLRRALANTPVPCQGSNAACSLALKPDGVVASRRHSPSYDSSSRLASGLDGGAIKRHLSPDTTPAEFALQKRISALEFLAQTPTVSKVVLLDKYGKANFSSPSSDTAAGNGWKEAINSEAFKSWLESNRYSGSKRTTFYGDVVSKAQPHSQPRMILAMAGGSVEAGVTIVEINLDALLLTIGRSKVGQTGYVYVLDSKGKLISHPHIAELSEPDGFETLPQIEAARKGALLTDQSGVEAVDRQGIPVLWASVPVPELGWRVFAEQPRSEALEPFYAALIRNLVVLAALLIACSVAGFISIRKMVAPIHALRRGAQAVGAGLMDHKIKIKTGDEWEALATQFNHMTQQLRSSYAELEKRVLDRTAELTKQKAVVERQNWNLESSHTHLQETQKQLKNALESLKVQEVELTHARTLAEKASEQKSMFLATMSHEMRTPLSGVIGMLGLALRDMRLWPDIRQQIELARRNAQSLLYIINDVLDVSKIEAGKLSLEKVDFDLPGMLQEVRMLLDERAQDKDLLLSLVIHPDIPPFVRSDPTRLRQIVLNLLGNAIKFTEKGEIRLSVRALRQSSDATELEFVVSDTGPGIAPETMARLFQKFEQADSSTTRRFGGTGLGLSICKDLLELMGGTIEAQSKVGKGSTFRFRLELAHGERPVSIPEDGWMPQSHSHQLRVLCAEDGPTNQIIIRSLLEEMGHVVEVVEDGLKAIKALSERDFDVVLMDGRMPYMDGQEAALKIRAGGTPDAPIRSTSIPIIALTANASKEGRSLYLTSGMNGFLSKPISEKDLFEELEKVVKKALDSGRSLPTLTARPLLNSAYMPSPNRLFRDTTTGLGDTITPPIPPERFEAPGNTQGAPAMPLNLRMTSIFIEEAPRRMRSALEALKAGNSKDLALEMHTLKSSVSYFNMQTLQSEFDRLEQKAESGQLESLESDLNRIDEMLKERIASLGNFADSQG